MKRTERLLDLVAYLLNSPQPVTWSDLQAAFEEDYASGSEASCRRKFERDKADILDLGIPLRHVDDTETGEQPEPGYFVDRKECFLPWLNFDSAELVTLYLACRAILEDRTFPYSREIKTAMEKVWLATSTRLDDEAIGLARTMAFHYSTPDENRDLQKNVSGLERAIEARKRVEIVYHTLHTGRTEKRSVDPYGLFCRHGNWIFVGFCHLRKGIRVFAASRVLSLKINGQKPKTPDFEVPPDFSLSRYMHQNPWNFAMHEPVEVEIVVKKEFSFLGGQAFGVDSSGSRDGWDVFRLKVTNTDAILGWALAMGPKVRIEAPDRLRQKIISLIEAISRKHGE